MAFRFHFLPIWMVAGGAVLHLAGCSKSTVPREEVPDLIVLQTGRLRGNVVPDAVKASGLQNFPYIAGYVKEVREEAAKTHTPVLLVDMGDSLTGTFASAVTHGATVGTFFNELRYDAVMLGNLDADLTPESLKMLKMPVLCPFQSMDGQPAMPGTQFSTTIKKDGLEVELLANFYGDTKQTEYPERFPSVFGTAEQVKPLRDYAELVKKIPAPGEKVLRIFEWLKFEQEGQTAPELLSSLRDLKVDLVLAHRVYGRNKVDAWVSTSTYPWNPPVSLNILRSNKGFALARADLKWVGGKWVLQRQKILPMVSNTAPEDKSIEHDVEHFAEEINQADKPIAEAENAISAEGILQRYLAALASVPGTTVALYSQQSVRAGWPKGVIRTSDVYASLPWARGLVQFEVTPEQYAELRSEKIFTFYTKADLEPTALRTVTTSDFLGRVVAQQLKLDRGKFRTVVALPEYEFFAKFLRRMADPSINPNQPTGWKMEVAP